MAEINNAGGTLRITHLNIRQSIFFLVLKLILLDIFGALASVLYFFSVSGEFIFFLNIGYPKNCSYYVCHIAVD